MPVPVKNIEGHVGHRHGLGEQPDLERVLNMASLRELGEGRLPILIQEDDFSVKNRLICLNGAAEYVLVRGQDLAPKPNSLDYLQAAAVPLSALTAWQALFDHGGLTKGQKVLIHGAAGGAGSFAVQLARWQGARVIATASARNFDFLQGLGTDEYRGSFPSRTRP